MRLTVIEGGHPTVGRPVVWKRAAEVGGGGAALVILDHETDPQVTLLAWDTGAAFLVGIRDVRRGPGHDGVVDAWRAQAAELGNAVRDERRCEPVSLADGVAHQLLVPGVAPAFGAGAALAALAREREARRRNAPLPQGGLFDETARQQGELF